MKDIRRELKAYNTGYLEKLSGIKGGSREEMIRKIAAERYENEGKTKDAILGHIKEAAKALGINENDLEDRGYEKGYELVGHKKTGAILAKKNIRSGKMIVYKERMTKDSELYYRVSTSKGRHILIHASSANEAKKLVSPYLVDGEKITNVSIKSSSEISPKDKVLRKITNSNDSRVNKEGKRDMDIMIARLNRASKGLTYSKDGSKAYKQGKVSFNFDKQKAEAAIKKYDKRIKIKRWYQSDATMCANLYLDAIPDDDWDELDFTRTLKRSGIPNVDDVYMDGYDVVFDTKYATYDSNMKKFAYSKDGSRVYKLGKVSFNFDIQKAEAAIKRYDKRIGIKRWYQSDVTMCASLYLDAIPDDDWDELDFTRTLRRSGIPNVDDVYMDGYDVVFDTKYVAYDSNPKEFRFNIKCGADMKKFAVKANSHSEALAAVKKEAIKYKAECVKSKFDGNKLSTRDRKK